MQDPAFRYQYRISQSPENGTSRRHSLAGWTVELGEALSLAHLRDRSGVAFGLLLGIAVDLEGKIIEGDFEPTLPQHFGWPELEAWIEGITGRFAVLLNVDGCVRLYTDACGMIGAVYDRQERRIASSLSLCLRRAVEDHPDYDHSAVAERGAKYILFDTRDKFVRRMNPSCYLSLNDFQETRFWPREQSISLIDGDLGKTYDWLTAQTELVVGAIARRHRTWLALSGGQDSRLLLAMAGSAIGDVERCFTHISNYANRIDATIAARMAEHVGVEHEVHDRKRNKNVPNEIERDMQEFQRGAGFAMPAVREVANGLARRLPKDAIVLRGHQTDILRAVFSTNTGANARRKTAWQVKRLMAVPYAEFNRSIHERFRPRYENWRLALPDFAEPSSTDLMFLELYYSSSLGCVFPALSRNFYMSPFNGRRQIAYAMAIDEAYRRRSFAVFDILYRIDPELHDIPFDFELGAEIAKINDADHVQACTKDRRKASAGRASAILGVRE